MSADGPSLLILLWEQQSPIRGCPGRASVTLASILEPAASTNGGRLGRIYFFIVPPGEVASPFFSAESAVLAPCVLASLPEGMLL